MKNVITLDQFRKLEQLAAIYNTEHDPDEPECFICAMLTTAEGDGPEPEETAAMVCLEAYDWDGETDFNTIHSMLEEAGIELDTREMIDGYDVNRLMDAGEWSPQAYMSDGDASYGRRNCRTYSYNLPLVK